MSRIKDLMISFESFIVQEHGHHSLEFMMKDLDAEEGCPVYELLSSEEYSEKELFQVAIEEDEDIFENWALDENLSIKEKESFLAMIKK